MKGKERKQGDENNGGSKTYEGIGRCRKVYNEGTDNMYRAAIAQSV
jgi:hypothetical protein